MSSLVGLLFEWTQTCQTKGDALLGHVKVEILIITMKVKERSNHGRARVQSSYCYNSDTNVVESCIEIYKNCHQLHCSLNVQLLQVQCFLGQALVSHCTNQDKLFMKHMVRWPWENLDSCKVNVEQVHWTTPKYYYIW